MRNEASVLVGRPVVAGPSAGACDVRVIESASATELYVTATPSGAGTPRRQAEEMYAAVTRVVREAGAAVVGERLFASGDAMAGALAARAAAYGDLDDGVAPTLLGTRAVDGAVVGAQVHAVRGVGTPQVHRGADGVPLARTFECDGYRYLTATAMRAPRLADGAAQTRAVFEQAEELLTRAGASLLDIARTWIWMDEILSWYGDLNRVRTAFFTERGVMSVPGRMPASTGIGVSPAAAGARVAIDLFAAWGKPDAVSRFHAAGNQRSAYEYGSAFARAARAKTPGGATVFCSGTAAIDAMGATCYLDDVAGQVRMTVENVGAVLRDMECREDDVVQALAYCANAEVKECFLEEYAPRLPWPCLTMTGDVCRSNLLFEVEVTACPGARRR